MATKIVEGTQNTTIVSHPVDIVQLKADFDALKSRVDRLVAKLEQNFPALF